MFFFRKILYVIFFSILSFQVNAKSAITISDAWIADGPPVIKVRAGYLQVKNNSDRAVNIVRVSSSLFASVEMHLSTVNDGVAKMIKQERVTIPANSTTEFKSGGLHLMMFDMKKKLASGDMVPLVFEFDNGTSLSVTALIKRTDENSMDHSHHQNH